VSFGRARAPFARIAGAVRAIAACAAVAAGRSPLGAAGVMLGAAGALLGAASALFVPTAARAEVTGDAKGFVVKHEVVVPLAPAAAYAQALRVPEWWDPEHTYSGKAENLSLRAEPGGCWCESLEGGGFVEHMRVVLAWPGRTLRLQGALGPLQEMGIAGSLTFAFKQEGEGTRVTMTYVVGGHAARGLEGIQKPVDMVLGQALSRYATKAGAAPAPSAATPPKS
jgi:uncharacterized protein YndB with AHSA1/START domain